MDKLKTVLKINIAILAVGSAGVILSRCLAPGEVKPVLFFYDISIGLLGGAVVAIVFSLHDLMYEQRHALRKVLNAFKREIRRIIPEDNCLTPEELQKLKELATGYRIVLSEYHMDADGDQLNMAVAKCINSDKNSLPEAVRELRQIVAK